MGDDERIRRIAEDVAKAALDKGAPLLLSMQRKEIDALRSRLTEVEGRARQAEALLRACMWRDGAIDAYDTDDHRCICCALGAPEHAADCKLAAFLASALPVGKDGGKVPDSESVSATPPTTPTCASWCGEQFDDHSHGPGGKHPPGEGIDGITRRDGICFCSMACARPLHPVTP